MSIFYCLVVIIVFRFASFNLYHCIACMFCILGQNISFSLQTLSLSLQSFEVHRTSKINGLDVRTNFQISHGRSIRIRCLGFLKKFQTLIESSRTYVERSTSHSIVLCPTRMFGLEHSMSHSNVWPSHKILKGLKLNPKTLVVIPIPKHTNQSNLIHINYQSITHRKMAKLKRQDAYMLWLWLWLWLRYTSVCLVQSVTAHFCRMPTYRWLAACVLKWQREREREREVTLRIII